MSLRKKTLLITGALVACLVAVPYLRLHGFLHRRLHDLEQVTGAQAVDRVLRALDEKIANMDAVASDWAAWDDTYEFVVDRNEHYIESTATIESLLANHLNLMAYVNAAGEVVFAKAANLIEKTEVPLPESLGPHLSTGGKLATHSSAGSKVNGIVSLPEGQMLVVSRPILTSQFEGPIRGSLVMGRYLDATRVERLGKVTNFELAVERLDRGLDDPEMSEDFREARSSLHGGIASFVRPLGDSLAGYAFVKDIYGRPALILRAMTPRDIYKVGAAGEANLILSLLAVSILFGVAIMVFLEKVVLSRVARLGSSVADINRSGDVHSRVPASGKDELAMLAQQMNRLLESIGQSQLTLQESREWFSTTLKSIGEGVIATSTGGNVMFANAVAEHLTGWSRDDAVGQPLGCVLQVIDEQTGQAVPDFTAATRSEGAVSTSAGVKLLVSRDGRQTPVTYSSAPIRDERGEIEGAVIVCRDATQRRQAEMELRRERNYTASILDTAAALVVVLDSGGRIVRFNRFCETLTGYDFEEVKGKCVWDLFVAPEELEAVKGVFARLLDGVFPSNHENHWLTKHGSRRLISWSNTVLTGDDGSIEYVVGIGIDITALKEGRASAALGAGSSRP